MEEITQIPVQSWIFINNKTDKIVGCRTCTYAEAMRYAKGYALEVDVAVELCSLSSFGIILNEVEGE